MINRPIGPDAEGERWFLPVVGLLLALLIAYGVGTLQGRENLKRSRAPHDHAASASDSAQRLCSRKGGDDLVDCVLQRLEAAEETARSEQDLTAQQQAAWGSMFGAAAAVIGAITTLLGLVWIKATLDATRETARAAVEANRISNEQNRGWLAVEVTDIGPIKRDLLRTDFSVEVRCRLKNAGMAPVTDIADTAVALDPREASSTKHQRLTAAIARRRHSGHVLGIAPGDWVEREFSITFSPQGMMGTVGLLNTLRLEAWIGAEYTSRGITGLTFSVMALAVEVPFGALSHGPWSRVPEHRQVGAMMT